MKDESLQCPDGGGEVQAASQTTGAARRFLQVSITADPSQVSDQATVEPR